jgi:hypothetical protein
MAQPAAHTRRDPILIGTLWMVGISVVLFFLPLINGLIGGLVGGYRVGSPGRAFLAAIIPAIIVAALLFLLLVVLDLPVLGFFGGLAAGVLILLADVGLLLGALIGGAVASTPYDRERREPA